MTAQQSQQPAPLCGDGENPFQTDALNDQHPDHVPAILPVKAFPDGEEQWGSVLYECPVTSCPFTVGAAGHGHPHFIFAWGSCPHEIRSTRQRCRKSSRSSSRIAWKTSRPSSGRISGASVS